MADCKTIELADMEFMEFIIIYFMIIEYIVIQMHKLALS